MGARAYTQAEEERYGLRKLPDVPFVGFLAAERLRDIYAVQRAAYRLQNPNLSRSELERL